MKDGIDFILDILKVFLGASLTYFVYNRNNIRKEERDKKATEDKSKDTKITSLEEKVDLLTLEKTEARILAAIQNSNTVNNQRFNQIDKRLDGIDGRLDRLEIGQDALVDKTNELIDELRIAKVIKKTKPLPRKFR